MATVLNNKELTALLLDHIAKCTGESGGGDTPGTPGYTPDSEGYAALLEAWTSIANTLKVMLPSEVLLSPTVAGITVTADNAWSLFVLAVIDALNYLDANKLEEDDLDFIALKADILNAARINVETMLADYIKASDIVTGTLTTEVLLASTAKFLSLISNTISSSAIESFNITSDHLTIANAFIKDAMIETVGAGKIQSGSLDTNKVVIRSTDGNMKLEKATMIITDDNDTVRVLIGQTVDEDDYTLTLWDADGNCIWDAEGIHRDAIKEAIIDDAAVLPNANISASKLNITSLVQSLNSNGGIKTSSANIIIDADNHTLGSWLSTMDTWKSGLADRVSTVETSVSQIDGVIQTLALKSDITTINTTINGINQSINTINTNYTQLTQDINTLSGVLAGLKTQVEDIDIPDVSEFLTEDDLDAYAKNSDLNTLKNRVTTVESNQTTINASMTGLTTTVQQQASTISEIGELLEDVEASTFVSQNVLNQTIANYSTQVEQTAQGIKTSVMSEISESLGDDFVTRTDYTKWFQEDTNGLTIGSSTSPVTLQLSNDGIKFYDNSTNPKTEIGFWDGNQFHSRNIKVDVSYSAQFGNFEWVPKSDGSLVLRKRT